MYTNCLEGRGWLGTPGEPTAAMLKALGTSQSMKYYYMYTRMHI